MHRIQGRALLILLACSGLGCSTEQTGPSQAATVPNSQAGPLGLDAPQPDAPKPNTRQTTPSARAQHSATVRRFLDALAAGPAALVARIRLPLRRPYPLPPVRDRDALTACLDEVLSPPFRRRLLQSTPDAWSEVGWRGTMFERGTLWLDDEGRVTTISHVSPALAKRRDAAIAADRARLHPSIRNFVAPVWCLETTAYRLRVDRLRDGGLRYTSWKKAAPVAAIPDLLLTRGAQRFDGSGGNETMTWTNGRFGYHLHVWRLGTEETPPFELRVTEKDVERMRQPAVPVFVG